jgi:hypothetical protein
MPEKKLKIILIVPPNRKDFYNQLKDIRGADIYILWHAREKDSKSDELLPFIKEQYYWSNYLTPYSLLKKIKPDRIVFFEIIDLRQIALIIAARSKKVKTFYLEHGAAGNSEAAIKRWDDESFLKNKLPGLALRFATRFTDIISAKLFYYSVLKKFNSVKSYLKFFFLPFKMLAASPNKVLSKNLFRERVPDHAIVFSEINFESFELYTGIDKKDAFLTGIPFFDQYYRNKGAELNYIVYIEHPYLEFGLLDWDKEHHKKIAKRLNDFATTQKIKLYIKLHPFSKKSNWSDYLLNTEYVQILQEGNFEQLYLDAKLIFGFSSSLITGLLCAQKNIVNLGWHPIPQIFGVDFSKTGLCHISFSVAELEAKFEFWKCHNLAKENETLYEKYLKRYNYPFDGKATERVIEAIAGNEVH